MDPTVSIGPCRRSHGCDAPKDRGQKQNQGDKGVKVDNEHMS